MATSFAEMRRRLLSARLWCERCATLTRWTLNTNGTLATCQSCRGTWDSNTVGK